MQLLHTQQAAPCTPMLADQQVSTGLRPSAGLQHPFMPLVSCWLCAGVNSMLEQTLDC